MHELDIFFNPKSVAIIGATEIPKFGYYQSKYLLERADKDDNFTAYPVNFKKDTIFGKKSYKSILDIPDSIELALILVNTRQVLTVFKESIKKEVRAIVLESSGFSETSDPELVQIQQELETLIQENNRKVRVIGPNCVGITNFENEFTTTDTIFGELEPGPISIISQSGVLGNIIIDLAKSQGLRFNKVISMGNKIDINENDLLDFLLQDEGTKVVAMYLEGVSKGDTRFIQMAKKFTRMKPLITVKNAKTSVGARAAYSHTASMAGNDAIYQGIFKQTGIIRAQNFFELFAFSKVLASQPLPRGNKIGILTASGSLGILACDEIVNQGLKLANLESESIEKMKEKAPHFISLKNPVDLGPAQMEMHDICVKALFEDPNVDMFMQIFCIPEEIFKILGSTFKKNAKKMQKFSLNYTKPIIFVAFSPPWMVQEFTDIGLEHNIPVVNNVQLGVRCLGALYKYKTFLERKGKK
ncbi:MAG: acetate--CoA ligase family protein [Candidatus Helarchaeota archaeon]